ncbi:unnamed protein product [Meloidogyne enterolobii]|uniref:Uncharacterized protein n=1 Tax=Meloidogyne enterolobii TaxID=390850 RepID=A0ACB0YLM2_MELEN
MCITQISSRIALRSISPVFLIILFPALFLLRPFLFLRFVRLILIMFVCTNSFYSCCCDF